MCLPTLANLLNIEFNENPFSNSRIVLHAEAGEQRDFNRYSAGQRTGLKMGGNEPDLLRYALVY
jgi:hypothetical protein